MTKIYLMLQNRESCDLMSLNTILRLYVTRLDVVPFLNGGSNTFQPSPRCMKKRTLS